PAEVSVSARLRLRPAGGRDARARPWIRVTTTMNHRMPQIRAHAADVLRFGWAERAPKFDRILTVPQTPGRGYTAPRPEHRASRSRTVRGGRSGMTRRPHRPEPRAAAISAAAPEAGDHCRTRGKRRSSGGRHDAADRRGDHVRRPKTKGSVSPEEEDCSTGHHRDARSWRPCT